MPKTEMNTLFRQYRALLENNGNELPGSPSGLREQLEEKPYQELNEFEKLMLFLAVYEEKAPSTAPRLKKDIRTSSRATSSSRAPSSWRRRSRASSRAR